MHIESCPQDIKTNPMYEQIHVDGGEIAQEIVRNCDFIEAFSRLKEGDLLDEQILLVKEQYGNILETATFLTERDWELLTYIFLYSHELALHSVETYELARSKIEHILLGSETIAEAITKENISLDDFYRACLLHDIGKTTIPESILNYALTPGDWQALSKILLNNKKLNEQVLAHLGLKIDKFEEATMLAHLTQANIDPVNTLPVHTFLSEKETYELTKRNISPELTLREILELHEQASQNILEAEGLHTEARIASQHHNYRHEPYHFPISSQTIGINADLSDLLRLADEEQALRSNRSYKPAFSRATAFALLVQDAERGAINKELTALWIQDDIQKGLFETSASEDFEKIESIREFVKTYCPKSEL